jgi:hypothetical protein
VSARKEHDKLNELQVAAAKLREQLSKTIFPSAPAVALIDGSYLFHKHTDGDVVRRMIFLPA